MGAIPHRINDEIKAIRQQQGLVDLERHHEFVRQYGDWFRARGIEPEDYISYMWAKYHRFAGGVHNPPNPWNGEWRGFIDEYNDASSDKIHQQLYRMLRPWEQP